MNAGAGAVKEADQVAKHEERTAARDDTAPDLHAMRNEDFISYKISVLSRIFDRTVDRRYHDRFGLSLTSIRILGHLHSHEHGRILSIARKMHMLGSQVSKSMLELVERDMVTKGPDPKDKRGIVFRLAPRGREIFEGVHIKAIGKQSEITELLGNRYSILSELLDTLITHYGSETQKNGRPKKTSKVRE